MIAVSEEMKNEDLKDPSNMEQEASEETASENTETSAEEKTTEKAPEKEGFFKKKKILRMKNRRTYRPGKTPDGRI